MRAFQSPNDFLHYLADLPNRGADPEHLPSLSDLSRELKVSVASLREQLEVAKALGLVEVRPRTGIRRQGYSFSPAVLQSLSYAMKLDQDYFLQFSDLRNHIETAYWFEAVALLTPADHNELQELMGRAWEKLRGAQIHIPHSEHRQLHMAIYRRLNNPFVLGILEAYWEAYVAVGLNMYADYDYLQQVWRYHQQMVDAICRGDFKAGYQALEEHRDLLFHRPLASSVEEATAR